MCKMGILQTMCKMGICKNVQNRHLEENQNGHILNDMEVPVQKQSRMIILHLQKSKATCTCKCTTRSAVSIAFQLAILQVEDYSVYGSRKGRLCRNFRQKAILSGHQNTFSKHFNCRLANSR